MTHKALARKLRNALIEARNHLEYCGYGDRWEQECAQAQNLERTIDDALTDASEAFGPEPKTETTDS